MIMISSSSTAAAAAATTNAIASCDASNNNYRTGWVVRVLLVAIAAALCSTSAAYPSGAPEQACKNLKPGHGAEPASGSSPFELSQDKLQVEANDQIKGK